MGINYEKIKNNVGDKLDIELMKKFEYSEILYIISKQIIEYRKNKKINQTQLAKKLGITQAMVSKIESGEYNFSIKFLVEVWGKLTDENYNFASKLLESMNEKVNNNYQKIYIKNVVNRDSNKYLYDKVNVKFSFKKEQSFGENILNDYSKLAG